MGVPTITTTTRNIEDQIWHKMFQCNHSISSGEVPWRVYGLDQIFLDQNFAQSVQSTQGLYIILLIWGAQLWIQLQQNVNTELFQIYLKKQLKVSYEWSQSFHHLYKKCQVMESIFCLYIGGSDWALKMKSIPFLSQTHTFTLQWNENRTCLRRWRHCKGWLLK